MEQKKIRQSFDEFTLNYGFNKVSRTSIISEYFVNEFNISGAHSYLMPVLWSNEKVEINKLSVRELCLRKADADIVGASNTHLLLFEMAIFGEFGYFQDTYNSQYNLLKKLVDYLVTLSIEKQKLIFSICGGGKYLDLDMPLDLNSLNILKDIGINENNIIKTKGRRNFILSKGIDRSAGYNIEIFYPKNETLVEIASMNIYEYLYKGSFLKKTINKGIGCGIGLNRINYILSEKFSIYDTQPFEEIINNLLPLFSNDNNSIELVKPKLFRVIEMIKALAIIFGEGYRMNSLGGAYLKVINYYISKISSEILFLNINSNELVQSLLEPIKCYYKDYINITDEVFNYITQLIDEKCYRTTNSIIK